MIPRRSTQDRPSFLRNHLASDVPCPTLLSAARSGQPDSSTCDVPSLQRKWVGVDMIVLGVILVILGVVLKISILYTIGIILLVVGVILAILGATGRAFGGRSHWF